MTRLYQYFYEPLSQAKVNKDADAMSGSGGQYPRLPHFRYNKVILWILLALVLVILFAYKSDLNNSISTEAQANTNTHLSKEPKESKKESKSPALPQCRMHSCFNYSRCGLNSGFPIYLYDPDDHNVLHDDYVMDEDFQTAIKNALSNNTHLVQDPKVACVYLVLIGEAFTLEDSKATAKPKDNTLEMLTRVAVDPKKLYDLPYWNGDGRNHVLLNLAGRDLKANAINILNNIDTMSAMIAQSMFDVEKFRHNFDLIVPPILGPTSGDVWQECPPMSPAKRSYLLSFQGEIHQSNDPTQKQPMDYIIWKNLEDMAKESAHHKFLLQFECTNDTEGQNRKDPDDWSLCGTDSSRKSILQNSTFALILPPQKQYVSSTLMLTRLYEALRSGAIPVILGADEAQLPYAETIDWRRAALLLPRARMAELRVLLLAIQDDDILLMRRQGRLIWERYLSTLQATVNTLIASLRDRLGIPPQPAQSFVAESAFGEGFIPSKTFPLQKESEEFLGPMEPPYPSPALKRNYTVLRVQSHEAWNDWHFASQFFKFCSMHHSGILLLNMLRRHLYTPIPRFVSFIGRIVCYNVPLLRKKSNEALRFYDEMDPFYIYPQLPFDPILPAEAKFIDEKTNFRPIGNGRGGTGNEFSKALGGNYPHEQFTIVILTYEREQILMNILDHFFDLPYLNKVVVVWNSPKPPAIDLLWPDIGVPIEVVRGLGNSLNNRFLPYDNIETEAVLSMDDDVELGHDEIVFGFRVWRENRERIVGFPGRFHTWNPHSNQSWKYFASYSCEISLILTGAAFFHKYYMYAYTYQLPQAIRDKVDEYKNCEDLAMNFLVSHITRKPPVKVTVRYTFNHPSKGGLSDRGKHYQERDKCINFLVKVFGYTPLLHTQYRADSILYHSKLPANKQKCFKNV